MSVYEKLFNIQQGLKAPKGQYNSFGKYKYRNVEDILEALKPLLKVNKCILTLSDELVNIGNRYYIKAVAVLIDIEEFKTITNQAYAREEESKKGMDSCQVTGASSSYARKYALNGMFGIDDNKDSDATNTGDTEVKKLTDAQVKRAYAIATSNNISNQQVKEWILKRWNINSVSDLSKAQYDELCQSLEKGGNK